MLKWPILLRLRSILRIWNGPVTPQNVEAMLAISDWSGVNLFHPSANDWALALIERASTEQLQSIRYDDPFCISDFYARLEKTVSFEKQYRIAQSCIDHLPLDILMTGHSGLGRKYTFMQYHPDLLLRLIQRIRSCSDLDTRTQYEQSIAGTFSRMHDFFLVQAYLSYPTVLDAFSNLIAQYPTLSIQREPLQMLLALHILATSKNPFYKPPQKTLLDTLADQPIFDVVFDFVGPNYTDAQDHETFMRVYADYFSRDEQWLLHWRYYGVGPDWDLENPGLYSILNIMDPESITASMLPKKSDVPVAALDVPEW